MAHFADSSATNQARLTILLDAVCAIFDLTIYYFEVFLTVYNWFNICARSLSFLGSL